MSEALYYAALGDPSVPVMINPEAALEDLQAKLDGALTKEFEGIPVSRVARLGDSAHLIADFVRMNGVDLIMMPTHGYGVFRRLLGGLR